MDLPKLVSLLQDKSIYLSKMAEFDDALEGGLTVADFFNVSNAPANLDNAISGFLPAINEDSNERQERLHKAKDTDSKLRKRTFQTPFGRYPCDDVEKIFPACKQWLYVNCWHQSSHECSAMWKLYGNDKNSVCIFTTTEKLKNSISSCKSFNKIEFYEVNYISHIDEIFPEEAISPFISKSKPYSFEKEFRIVAWDSNVNLSKHDVSNEAGILVRIDPETLIEKLVVSPHSDPWFKSLVKNLCDKFGLEVNVADSEIRTEALENIFDVMVYYETNNSK